MEISLEPQEWQLVLNILQQQPWHAVNSVILKLMHQAQAQAQTGVQPAMLNGQAPHPAIGER